MKILYKQPKDAKDGSLNRFCVHNCYLKKISIERDFNRITKKPHHHTDFEMHIIVNGFEEYEVDGKVYKLHSGDFLLIYPNVSHTVISHEPRTQKYSITFNKPTNANQNCILGKYDERIFDNLTFISNEALQNKEISSLLIENSILETLVWVFRLAGIKENKSVQINEENAIVTLAKQYIEANIELNPSVSDVAKYSYLSTKQLTRIFNAFEGISPGEYIIKTRIARIEKLVLDRSFSLKRISDIMHFNNEYYFNAFFKKHFGMPPGEYRKMLGQ